MVGMPDTTSTLQAVLNAGEDFEWYPTTQRMIEVVARHIPRDARSIMDIGAGDGRVLVELAKRCENTPDLYAIEKSPVLAQAQPESITPVGTDFYEQNLACLPVDYIFSNPPYSQFEPWAAAIIESGFAKKAFLVIPQRWAQSARIQGAIKKRGARVRVVHSDTFTDADRASRAVVDIVEVSYPRDDEHWGDKVKDPFDIWFDQNISAFDVEPEAEKDGDAGTDIAKLRHLTTIGDLVDSYNEEHARMEENYRAIFKLDSAILRELGVSKDNVREGIKTKMSGLKGKYWGLLFERLDTITNRLATETKQKFLERLTGRTAVAFTAGNAYTVAIWAIKHANKYYDQQLVKLFRDLSTHEGVMNYKSNQRTWQKDGWRYNTETHSHYALDYRIVLNHYSAITGSDYKWESPGGLHKSCHELIDDIIAVLHNLGFPLGYYAHSRQRRWTAGQWEDFYNSEEDAILFQVKAFKNGNLHFRFMPDAIRALNVEAGRLLGWIRSREDVVAELGYSEADAARFFGCNMQLGASAVKLLAAG